MILPPVRMHSFGCRLNQLETEAVALAFSRAGFPVLSLSDQGRGSDDDEADAGEGSVGEGSQGEGSPLPPLYFINTCTVTTKAEQKARRVIRGAMATDPEALVIVSGCYAQMDGDDLRALGHRVIVVPGSFKDSLLGLPGRLVERMAQGGHEDALALVEEELRGLATGSRDPFAFAAADFRFHSRASLKVQDGCDNACTYCRVRLARGKSRSLDPEEVLRRARELEAAGWAEVVLTGVNLSQYSWEGLGLGALLSFLHSETSSLAFRVSSFEPDRIDEAFLEAAGLERVRPFFHFPLQSASPAVLRRMGRDPSVPDSLRAVFSRLRASRGDPFLSLDLITGFPGEGEEDHGITRSFVQDLAPASLHVFSYSPRPGTAALKLKPPVPERIAVARSAELIRLAVELRSAFVSRQAGRVVEAVMEGGPRPGPWPRRAFTENALSAGLAADPGLRAGSRLRIRLSAPPPGADIDLVGLPEPNRPW